MSRIDTAGYSSAHLDQFCAKVDFQHCQLAEFYHVLPTMAHIDKYVYDVYTVYHVTIIILWSQPAPSKRGTKEGLDWL
jgi:hypothetical protein